MLCYLSRAMTDKFVCFFFQVIISSSISQNTSLLYEQTSYFLHFLYKVGLDIYTNFHLLAERCTHTDAQVNDN